MSRISIPEEIQKNNTLMCANSQKEVLN